MIYRHDKKLLIKNITTIHLCTFLEIRWFWNVNTIFIPVCWTRESSCFYTQSTFTRTTAPRTTVPTPATVLNQLCNKLCKFPIPPPLPEPRLPFSLYFKEKEKESKTFCYLVFAFVEENILCVKHHMYLSEDINNIVNWVYTHTVFYFIS